jgi:hypothetical protein
MLQKGVIMNTSGIAVLAEEFAAIYAKFQGLEEIYPQAEVSCIRVENIKNVYVIIPTWNMPGVLVLHGGERLLVDDNGQTCRQIGLGKSFVNKFNLLEAIRKFSPASPGAYAVLIQGRNLTIFAK